MAIMNVAIIGCGIISPLHVMAILETGNNIVALCDIDTEAARRLKERFGLDCNLYEDYKAMAERERLDCVHICTPHHLHCEMAEFLLSKNINVLCEKPLVISEDEAQRLKRAAENSSAQLGVCLQNRYLESNVKTKELVSGANILAVFAMVAWHRDEAYYKSAEWRGKKSTEGGGLLINQAIHTLDLLMYFFGDVKSIQASIENRSLKGIIEVEDTAECYLELERAKVVFFASNAIGVDYPAEIRIMTEKSDIRLISEKLYVDSQEIISGRTRLNKGKFYWGYGHGLLIRDFYDKLSAGEKFPLDFEVGYKCVKLVLDIYKAAGKPGKVT